MIEATTQRILCTFFGQGRQHNFKLFRRSGIHFDPNTRSLQDKEYQEIQHLHGNSEVPKKKPQRGTLSREDKAYTRALAKERIGIEHVNRRLKTFRILAERYRNRRLRFGLRGNLIAALYNLEYAQTA